MNNPLKFRYVSLTALCATLGFASLASAQTTVTTVPVGAMTVTAAAGTGVSRTISVLSCPLSITASTTGQATGLITGITTSTIVNSNAGWSPGALSVASIPYIIRITSGTAKGSSFLVSTVTPNTATTVTLDSEEAGLVDLTTSGLTVGDSYCLIPCDTLSSLMGTPSTTGILGSTSSASADVVLLKVGTTYRQYYFNTSTSPGKWLRVGLNTPSDDVPVRPDTALIYNRLGNTAISFVFTGTVPSIQRKAIVRNTGVSTIGNFWPADVTLANTGIASIPGWKTVAASTFGAGADIVQVLVGTTYRQYYNDGTNWRRVGLNTISDTSVSISAGTVFFINKNGVTAGATRLTQLVPYTL